MSAKEKGRGGGLSLSGWSSRGPRPRARCKGGRNPRGHFVSTDPRRHRALSRFQSCFVRRGNGFVARPGSGVWCERNSDASGRHGQPGRQCEFHCEFSGDAASFIAGARVSCSNRPKNLLLAASGGAGARPRGLLEEQNGETSYHVASAPDPSDSRGDRRREPSMRSKGRRRMRSEASWERWGHPNAGAMKSFYYDKRPKAHKPGAAKARRKK